MASDRELVVLNAGWTGKCWQEEKDNGGKQKKGWCHLLFGGGSLGDQANSIHLSRNRYSMSMSADFNDASVILGGKT